MRVFVSLAVIFVMMFHPIQNAQVGGGNAVVQDSRESSGIPRADVIVKKVRLHNGVLQYRRWNKTRSCWVDPDWIDVG